MAVTSRVLVGVCLLMATVQPALAQEPVPNPPEPKAPKLKFVFMPGSARAITRTDSSSRDSPRFEFAYGPRAQGSVGAEFGYVQLILPAISIRTGFYFMVALENATQSRVFPPVELWRGLLGTSVSVSFDRWAARLLGPRGA